MKNDVIQTAADEIAHSLFDSELAIESGIGSIATLVAALPSFKKAAGLTVFHAQDVLEQASEVMDLLTQARRKAGELHRKIGAVHRQLGLEPIAFGPIGKPPLFTGSMEDARQIA